MSGLSGRLAMWPWIRPLTHSGEGIATSLSCGFSSLLLTLLLESFPFHFLAKFPFSNLCLELLFTLSCFFFSLFPFSGLLLS
jgi:hypothetical protein